MTIRPVNIASVDFASGVNQLLRQFRAQEQQKLQEDSLRATAAHRNRMFDRLVANDAQAQENFNLQRQDAAAASQAAAARAEADRAESLRRFEINTGLARQRIANSAENAAATRAAAEAQRKATEAFRNRPNDTQSKAAGFVRRTINAEKTLASPDGVQEAISYEQMAKSNVPIVGNSLVSRKRRQYDQAKRNFINAVLRRESGAAIAESEFENANQQYFPQPGDDPGTIQAKVQNRRDAIQGLIDSSGPLASRFTLPPMQDTSPVSNSAKKRLRFNPQTGDFE